MPYSASNPPAAAKGLPSGAKKIFIAAFNSVYEQKGEESAFKIAWAAVKQKYRKEGDTWVAKDKATIADRKLPLEVKTMPEEAKSIFKAVFSKSVKESPEDLAAILALNEVRKHFTMEGEEWVKREEQEGDPDFDGEEGENLEGEEEGEGEENKKQSKSGEEKSPAYSKTTKTTETTETKGEAAGGTGDSAVMLLETLMLDASAIERFGMRTTASGYLVAEPRVARTGIQIYRGLEVGMPTMDEVRVYRPEAEVFDRRAMASLAHRPVTLDHPDESVDPKNWKKLAVGHSTGDVARDGDFIRVPLALMDQAAIDAVKSGRSQLSVGYGATLKWGPGKTSDGQLYDAVQTDIRANHIALVTKARGGDMLAMGDEDDGALDRDFTTEQRKTAAKAGQAMPGGGFPIKSESDLRNAIRAVGRAKNPDAAKAHIKKRARALGLENLIPSSWGDSKGVSDDQQRSVKMTERVLNVDGVDIALEDKDGQILERHLTQLRKQLTDAQAVAVQVTELQKTIGVKDGEIAVLNKKVEDGKVTPQMLDEFCRKRMDVVGRAVRVLGDSYTFDNKSDAQIRREVVASDMGEQAAKEMTDENVLGAFNHITKPQQQDGFQRLTQSFSRAPAYNPAVNDAAANAYNKRNDELAGAYKKNKKPFSFGATKN